MSKNIKNIPFIQFLIGSLRHQSKSGPKCKPKGPKGAEKSAVKRESSQASTFRLISLAVVSNVIALTAYIFVNKEEHERPEFIPYTHLRLRHKGFPWGDGNHSFFHNPRTNALPKGYEDDIQKKEKEELGDIEAKQEPEKSAKAKKED